VHAEKVGEIQTVVISETHKFVFVAVPKTGSSSMEEALAPYQSSLTEKFNRHATCLKLQRELPQEVWRDYFKFAFVRDPYDRMLSWYFYRKRNQLKDPSYSRHHLYTGNISFDEFVGTFSKNELMFKQVDFIAPHNGGLLVDTVGRFENLQEDFSNICEQLSIPHMHLPLIRASKKPSAGLRGIWTSKSRGIVNEYFREDFEFFGYRMLLK